MHGFTVSLYCPTVSLHVPLSHCDTLSPFTVSLSHGITVTVLPSHCLTVSQSHYFTVSQSHYFTVFLSKTAFCDTLSSCNTESSRLSTDVCGFVHVLMKQCRHNFVQNTRAIIYTDCAHLLTRMRIFTVVLKPHPQSILRGVVCETIYEVGYKRALPRARTVLP